MPNDYMARALQEARQGLGQTSPNPAVGAVLVRDHQIVGVGHHIYEHRKHAEIVALEQAGSSARGATLYVTLEPCAHQGRTGPCAQAVIDAGVTHVVAAMQDPNPLVSGSGFAQLRAAGVKVSVDPDATAEAEALNEPFCFFMRERRPLVTLKSAVTLDGKIAAPDDNTGWITSAQARAHVQQLRHNADAIVTGIGTVEADDCHLTDRTGLHRSRPLLRIVLDSLLRIKLDSQMVRSGPADLLVVTTSAANTERRAALQREGVEIAVLDGPDGRTNPRALVELLAGRQIQSLMIEAGSKVNGAMLESGVVDKIFFYYAPKILGGLQSLPVVGGRGRRRRADAMEFRDLRVHLISQNEFAVEAGCSEEPGNKMFTGIVEELGAVESLQQRGQGARLRIRCARVLTDAFEGASIAVNGVCLTALALQNDSFAADLAPETMARTNLGDLRPGKRVNLERPLSPAGRLGGHIMQGHVDGTGEFLELKSIGNDNWWLSIRVPEELDRYLVWKGSVAIDGISLTVAKMESRELGVTIIPHTFQNTTLGGYRPGDRVNLEADILAKYVEKLLRRPSPDAITAERLQELGY